MSGNKNLPFPSCIWRVERASNMHRKISTAQDLMCYRSAMHCDIPGAASTLLSAQNQLSLLLRERRDPEPPAALTGIPAQGCARCVLSPPCSLIKQRPTASSTRENNVWTRKVLLPLCAQTPFPSAHDFSCWRKATILYLYSWTE